MFRTNESLEALCAFVKNRKFDLRRMAKGIDGPNEGRIRQLGMCYINTVIADVKKAFCATPHIIDEPELPAITQSYIFARDQKQGIQVTDRHAHKTFTTIDAISALGSSRLLTVVDARIGNRDSYVSEYFKKIQRKIQAMLELAPQGFGWVLLLSSDQIRQPKSSPFLDEFKRMNGKEIVLPYSTTAFRGAVAYHKTG